MAAREVVYDNQEPGTFYICGRTGVWQTKDNGRSFSSMDAGYPVRARYRCLQAG